MRMARPRKTDLEKRTERIGIRLTQAERAALELSASSLGLCAADFVRSRALGYRIGQRADREAMARIATALIRLGNNLNQIARHMNTGRDAPAYLPELISRIDRELDRLYDTRDHESGPVL